MTGELPMRLRYLKKGAFHWHPITDQSVSSPLCANYSLICEVIITHLTEHKALKSSQCGLVSHHSCLTNLLEYMETITTLLDQGHNVDVFYLDFSEAFDQVPHQRLLVEPKAHGIVGDIFKWVEAWLCNRKQRVLLNDSQSEWSRVTWLSVSSSGCLHSGIAARLSGFMSNMYMVERSE